MFPGRQTFSCIVICENLERDMISVPDHIDYSPRVSDLRI